MDRQVQLFAIGIIGVAVVISALKGYADTLQVCAAGLIGFLGAKAAVNSEGNNTNGNIPVASAPYITQAPAATSAAQMVSSATQVTPATPAHYVAPAPVAPKPTEIIEEGA